MNFEDRHNAKQFFKKAIFVEPDSTLVEAIEGV